MTQTQAQVPAKPPLTFGRRLRRIGWRLLRLVLIILLVALVLGYFFQEKLIFFGAVRTHGVAEFVLTQAPVGGQLVTLQATTGESVAGLFVPASEPRTRPTILYFYGNAECMADTASWFLAEARKLNCNLMLVDYLGYGGSGGSPSEAGCYAAADAAYEHLLTRPEVDPRRIVVGGWSLGAAVACDLASKRPVAGLFMFSGFTSMNDLARHHYWFLPTDLVLRHHFRSLDKIGSIAAPILISHGRRDSTVPFAMSERLRAAAVRSAKVTYLPMAEANHNDLFEVGLPEIEAALKTFLVELPR